MTKSQKYLSKALTKLGCAGVPAWLLFCSLLYEGIEPGLTVWERFFSLHTLNLLLVIMIIGFCLVAFVDLCKITKEEESQTEK
jgi:cytochrome bd-type quinol oxidase subunit 2